MRCTSAGSSLTKSRRIMSHNCPAKPAFASMVQSSTYVLIKAHFVLDPARRLAPSQSIAVVATFASSSGFFPNAKAARRRSRW